MENMYNYSQLKKGKLTKKTTQYLTADQFPDMKLVKVYVKAQYMAFP